MRTTRKSRGTESPTFGSGTEAVGALVVVAGFAQRLPW